MLRWEKEEYSTGWRGYSGKRQVAIAYQHQDQFYWEVGSPHTISGVSKHGHSPTFEQCKIEASTVFLSLLNALIPDGYQLVPKVPTPEMIAATRITADEYYFPDQENADS